MKSGLGRPRREDKYDDPRDYLNEIVFPEEEALEFLKKRESKKLKEYNAIKGRVGLQKQKLEYAYNGMRKFKK